MNKAIWYSLRFKAARGKGMYLGSVWADSVEVSQSGMTTFRLDGLRVAVLFNVTFIPDEEKDK